MFMTRCVLLLGVSVILGCSGKGTLNSLPSSSPPIARAGCVPSVDPARLIDTFAGTGQQGFAGDGAAATLAQLNYPSGVAADTNGNIFIADSGNRVVRKVDSTGVITTVAGQLQKYGFSGDGGPATSAELSAPTGIAVDAAGNLYISDTYNFRVRKVGADGVIQTIAGNGTYGLSGDGGSALTAQFNVVGDLTVDAQGAVYVADLGNYRIRKVSANGTISSVVGNGGPGFSGDGGPAASAQISTASGITVDGGGNVIFSDWSNQRIRMVTPSGVIYTIAGNGQIGFSGDGGDARAASLNFPGGVVADSTGAIFFTDTYNGRIRRIDCDGTISTVAGAGDGGFSGDGGPALNARLNYAREIAMGSSGTLVVTDGDNFRIRSLTHSR